MTKTILTSFYELGTDAPDWKLHDPAGRTHSLADYRGKVVLLDFWGTWCLPCRVTMPGIQSIHEKFRGRGVAVLGIAIGGAEAGDPVAFMKSHGFTYGPLLNGDEVATSYHVVVLPALYLVGEDGKIIHAEYGVKEGGEGRTRPHHRSIPEGARALTPSSWANWSVNWAGRNL